MSELLKVAAALRSMSDEKLQKLINERMINSNQLVDFFDLAEALTKPASVSSTIAGLPLSQARELRNISANQAVNEKIANELADQLLIGPGPDYKPFASTVQALAEFANLNTTSISIVQSTKTPEQDQVDRDSGIEIFETLQAITELVFDLEHRFVREVGRKNVGLPDLKRFASHLRKSNDYAKQIYELAHLANLITLADGRWQLSAGSGSWLGWQPAERFAHLAKTWREILGDASSLELKNSFKNSSGVVSLVQHLNLTYPFADGSISSKISKLSAIGALIGLAAEGWMSSWTKPILECNYKVASELAIQKLPTPQAKLICQADLSLIAPGPLPTEVEMTVRRFADTEQIGMASTYRLSALSISHGLETGLSVSEIRTTLETLSGTSLPQPIEYLLAESEKRFARLRITGEQEGGRTYLQSSDLALLAEITNEIKLKPFALVQLEDGSLATRFEPEVLYFGLRELGFVAVRVDESGAVISPLSISKTKLKTEDAGSLLGDITRLRAQEEKLGTSPDDDDLHRQIQLAIKNKTRARFLVKSNTGAEIEFLLEPIGMANGRLRAKDRKADIERTLPIASIIKVTLD